MPIFTLILLACPTIGSAKSLSGIVNHVRDGDTIEVDGRAVRLEGVHAPERGEKGGSKATAFMTKLVNGKRISCELNGQMSYDRVVGICFLDGQDIGRMLIEAGLGRDCPRYSKGRYFNAEKPEAKSLPLPKYC